MSHAYKRILVGLVPTEDDQGEVAGAAHYAVSLAQRFGAHLTIHAFVPYTGWVPYSAWSDLPARLIAADKQRLSDLAETTVGRTRTLADDAGVEATSDLPELTFEALTDRFNHLTRVQDLTVLDASGDALGSQRHIFDEALFNSGRPVIVVPRDGGSPAAGTIVVAWDGSARSARAAGDALPLLQGATKVSIATVAGEKDLSRMTPGADLAAYLASHGVAATPVSLQAIDGDPGEALRRHAGEIGADLIVMGAFAHSRFREAVLGGVTRSLLEDAPAPLFMAH